MIYIHLELMLIKMHSLFLNWQSRKLLIHFHLGSQQKVRKKMIKIANFLHLYVAFILNNKQIFILKYCIRAIHFGEIRKTNKFVITKLVLYM